MSRKTYTTRLKNFQKKRQPVKKQQIPQRKCLLDVLKENYKQADRKCCIHRMIYLGEVFENPEETMEFFKDSVEKINNNYSVEKLTGILLCYENYFFHIIEGMETVFIQHFHYLNEQGPSKEWFQKFKLLVVVNNIKDRFLDDWQYLITNPPQLLEQLESDGSIETCMRFLKGCIEKLYGFAKAFIKNYKQKLEESKSKTEQLEKLTQPSLERTFSQRFFSSDRKFSQRLLSQRFSLSQRLLSVSADPSQRHLSVISSSQLDPSYTYREFLPEIQIIEFIMNCRFVKPIIGFFENFETIPQIKSWFEDLWPIPSELVPYNVFEEPYNVIVEIENVPEEDLKEDDKNDTEEQPNLSVNTINTGTVISVPTLVKEEAGSLSATTSLFMLVEAAGKEENEA